MFYGHLKSVQKSPLGGRPNTNPPRDRGTPDAPLAHVDLLYFIMLEDPRE
jgi:hypothetical protein